MSRRCKAGQRARILGEDDSNAGNIVLIVRPYFGELIDGSRWPEPLFPWVVTSLGDLLDTEFIKTGELSRVRTAVYEDCALKPLDDDEDDDSEHTSTPREKFDVVR